MFYKFNLTLENIYSKYCLNLDLRKQLSLKQCYVNNYY